MRPAVWQGWQPPSLLKSLSSILLASCRSQANINKSKIYFSPPKTNFRSARPFVASVPSLVDAPKSAEVVRLPNGLRIVSCPMASARKVATVGVWLNFGSRAESEADNGVVHFLEHMTFKGTQAMGRSDIEGFVEKHGAHLNAYTTKEHVAYFANCLSADAPSMLALIFDLLRGSTIETSAVEEEKRVILREAKEVEVINEEVLFDKIHEQCFPESSLGRTILGSRDKIEEMTRDRLVQFINSNYNLQNMVVLVTGDCDMQKVLSYCNSLPSSPVDTKTHTCAKPHFQAGKKVFIDATSDPFASSPQLFVSRTSPGVSWSDPDFFIVMLIRTLLAQSSAPSSSQPTRGARLKVPTSLPPATDDKSFTFFDAYYNDCGLIGAYQRVKVPTDLIEIWSEAYSSIECLRMPEFQTVATEQIESLLDDVNAQLEHHVIQSAKQWTADDLSRAQEGVITMFAQALDSSGAICEELGRQILVYGRALSFDEVASLIRSVGLEELKTKTSDFVKGPHALTALLRLPSSF